MNLNKVFIVGRVTAQPELRSTPSGQAVSGFGVATNRVWTDKAGARKEETEFHNIVVWGRQAEIATQFLTKGSLVLIEGRLQTRSWQDKQGQTRKTTDIIAERIQLGPRPLGGGGAGQAMPPKFEGQEVKDMPSREEIPIVDIEEETKQEDLPF